MSGNCNAAIGIVGGLRANPLGVVWFDAHGDFKTPETTTSGFFDGMGLATVAGLCWKNLAASVADFAPVPGESILHVGSRDVSEDELANMRQVGVQVCTASEIRSNGVSASLPRHVRNLAECVADVYVHVDLDVINPSDVHANGFSPPEGLSVGTMVEMLRVLKASLQIAGLSIASYDPIWDPESRAAGAVSRFLQVLNER
ncbi:MAG: arginase family protein [Chthoniobacterales bacterium]|nr:arginase family protein [Chthoniobacterales bacterium]